ncbi:unnamed protein product [Eruca vesicaria subsp. sativa]|uniref:Protein kinase domain-containing protein n=1 Tax=Eruca vesicaria subsp. sativa TaxID=29727 RepID=A0ABC8JWV6_ERUVS|nr:unnamed protein product [Eruca vesicaria subsp. sativa]
MENLGFRDSVSLFLTMVVIVLVFPPHLTLYAYSHPDKFYINCGSNSNVTYAGRTFIGDMASGANFVSFTKNGTEARNQSGSSISPEIYGTVRIFTLPSSYKFQLDSVGLHFLRLHFSAVSSPKELLTARFNVSATSGSTHHLQSFSLQNFNETPRVEEFLLMINSPELEIGFVPELSSVAIVNAIEVFSAHNNNLTVLSDSDKNLHTIYRLNVGGQKITPEHDALGRTWSLDDDYLYEKDSSKNILSSLPISAPDFFIAPDSVYRSAKKVELYHQATFMNVTWCFMVKTNIRHFIRVHFYDIKNNQSQSSDSDFYLYVNGYWRIHVNPLDHNSHGLVIPFYIDIVNVSDGSGLLNVSIGNKVLGNDIGFLNGLEIMEFLERSGSDSSGGSSYWVHIIAGCFAAGLIIVLSLLFMVFLKRRRSNKKKKADAEIISVWSPLQLYRGGGSSDNRHFYSDNNSALGNFQLGLKIPYTDILIATNNFDEMLLIGKGGFGDVYKAILPDGSKVAIKRGKTGSGQGILEFETEIQVLSRIWHRHLVSLTGYCKENSEMILVYEFIEKGTLQEHLYGSDLPSLSWKQRLEICIGASRGLHYLHSGSEEAIIHRDVKSTNILLDENYVAKVADFGISKLVVRNQEPISISTNIKGTYGYLDPEYLLTRVLTDKSDVYSFGVVLLEVLCARPALNRHLPPMEQNLADWVMSCKSKRIVDRIIDPSLVGQIEPNILRKFMEVAEKCLKDNGDARPSMANVSWELEYILRLQMMAMAVVEDSAASISSSLVIPRLMVSDSFSCNSIVQEDQVKNRYVSTDSYTIRVFPKLDSNRYQINEDDVALFYK